MERWRVSRERKNYRQHTHTHTHTHTQNHLHKQTSQEPSSWTPGYARLFYFLSPSIHSPGFVAGRHGDRCDLPRFGCWFLHEVESLLLETERVVHRCYHNSCKSENHQKSKLHAHRPKPAQNHDRQIWPSIAIPFEGCTALIQTAVSSSWRL